MIEKQIGVFTKILRNDSFVKQAIQSVLGQSYRDFNYYIMVGDATRDEVLKIAGKDERIILIEAEDGQDDFHRHYREIAERHSYVFTMDGDDWLEEDCLEKSVSLAVPNNLDIVVCGFSFMRKKGESYELVGIRGMNEDIVLNIDVLLSELPMFYNFFRAFWGKLWRSDLLLKQEQLIDGIQYGGYGGDSLECFQLLNDAKWIGVAKDYLYNYRMNEKSASHQLMKGRLKSDSALFYYVVNILKRCGRANGENMRFLFAVYFEATRDTMNLIAKANLSDKERDEAYREVITHPLTMELMALERRRKIKLPDAAPSDIITSVKGYAEIIFGNMKGWEKVSTQDIYYNLFLFLYPNYKNKFTKWMFLYALRNSRVFSFLIQGYEIGILIEYLKGYQLYTEEERNDFLLFAISETTDDLVKSLMGNAEFVLYYTNFCILVILKKYAEMIEPLAEEINKQTNDMLKMDLIDLWINIAAITENADDFIQGKLMKFENAMLQGNYDIAKGEYLDIKEMGFEIELSEKEKSKLALE